MADGLRPDAARLAQESADQVQIMNAVKLNLDAIEFGGPREKFPWRGDVETEFDVDQFPEQSAIEGIADGEHHRGETQLEIDGRSEFLAAAKLANPLCIGEIDAHRFLHQDCGFI